MKKIIFALCIFLNLWNHRAQAADAPTTPVSKTTTGEIADVDLPDPKIEENKDAKFFLRHQPLYFLYGNPVSVVQLSFKYQVHKDYPFYPAYTQKMYWRLREESKPFRDINFNPEFLYRLQFNNRAFVDSIDLLPYIHKSNGTDGPNSRSYDGSAVQFNFRGDILNWAVKGHLRFRKLFALDQNPNLVDYIGPMEVGIGTSLFTSGFIEKGELYAVAYPGGEWAQHWGRGGQEVNFSFRIRGLDLTPSFYIQYFHGYGESLLNYYKKENTIRVGFQL